MPKALKLSSIVVLAIASVLVLAGVPLGLLSMIRCFVEMRSIPSTSMEPTLRVGDRLAIEKLSTYQGKDAERGAIIIFYPPPSDLPGGKDLSYDLWHVLGRATGLSCFPYEPAFIKRVIAISGDHVEVKKGIGVFVNGRLLAEPYKNDVPAYDVRLLADLGGRNPYTGALQCPYPGNQSPVVVPPGCVFVLGDNRNMSEDSHTFGFLKKDRIIGRAWWMYFPISVDMHAPYWVRPSTDARSY